MLGEFFYNISKWIFDIIEELYNLWLKVGDLETVSQILTTNETVRNIYIVFVVAALILTGIFVSARALSKMVGVTNGVQENTFSYLKQVFFNFIKYILVIPVVICVIALSSAFSQFITGTNNELSMGARVFEQVAATTLQEDIVSEQETIEYELLINNLENLKEDSSITDNVLIDKLKYVLNEPIKNNLKLYISEKYFTVVKKVIDKNLIETDLTTNQLNTLRQDILALNIISTYSDKEKLINDTYDFVNISEKASNKFYKLTASQLNKVYNMDEYNVFMAILFGGIFIFILLITILSLAERLFSIIMLVLIGPIPISVSILDDSKRYEIWRDTLLSKILGVTGIMLALSLYCTLSPILVNTLGANNLLIELIILLGGLLFAMKGGEIVAGLIGSGLGVQEGLSSMRSLLAIGGGLKATAIGVKGALIGSKSGINGASGVSSVNGKTSFIQNIASRGGVLGKTVGATATASAFTRRGVQKFRYGNSEGNRISPRQQYNVSKLQARKTRKELIKENRMQELNNKKATVFNNKYKDKLTKYTDRQQEKTNKKINKE